MTAVSALHPCLVVPIAAAVLGVAQMAVAAERELDPLREALRVISHRSIFFGHQSVGWNVIDALQQLASAEGVALEIVRPERAGDVPAGTFAHDEIGANGDPRSKVASFARALGAGAGPEIAFMKFCYADIDAATDVQRLFTEYMAGLNALKVHHPRTVFVHVTAPLTTVQGGARGFVKRLLGKAPNGLAENERREAFNALLREATEGKEPLFDLARIESTRPDGAREEHVWEGKSIPALAPDYTDDGGHLNALGGVQAARELVATLASVLRNGTMQP